MPVQRTPPQRVNPPSVPINQELPGDVTLPTPSHAFKPSNRGVMRTPPPGSEVLPSQTNESSIPSVTLMDLDVIPVESGPSTTPPVAEVQPPISGIPAPTTPAPAPKTPRSKKTPAQVLAEPAIQIPIDENAVEDWGKRYEITQDTLELAVRAGARKWTSKDLQQCFPILSSKDRETVENVYLSSSLQMRSSILTDAKSLFDHYKVGPALQMIDQVVAEARSNFSISGRPDAWRPDLSPYALIAATNLPIYDEAYGRLRDEYLALHEDCQTRFQSIRAKQALLKELEGAVSEGVVELEKTTKLLENFPSEEMMQWMEDTVNKLEGGRAA